MKLEPGLRIWEGMILRLSSGADGKPLLECWLKERYLWKPCGLMNEYLRSKPATAAEVNAAGLTIHGIPLRDLIGRLPRATYATREPRRVRNSAGKNEAAR
jgi:hypothetical protein